MQELAKDIVVIEGLGGAGKTTTAQNLARHYGYSNFNTGTLFRAAAAAINEARIELPDTAAFVEEAHFAIDLSNPEMPNVAVNDNDVTKRLQTPLVTNIASIIGSQEGVAEILEAAFTSQVSGAKLVVEGKNLGERFIVPPSRHFYLIASPNIRAYRKWRQAVEKGDNSYTFLEARRDIMINDLRDKPLLRIQGSVNLLDTSNLTPDQVVQVIMRRVEEETLML